MTVGVPAQATKARETVMGAENKHSVLADSERREMGIGDEITRCFRPAQYIVRIYSSARLFL